MHCSQRESRRLVHKPPAAPRSRSTSRSRATESFSVLPPLSPQIPAPPRTPEPYRLTSNHARRDNGAFVILPEVSPPVRSRSPSPGGRASPFKIRTFRESTLPSRHTSREPSPERKSILKRKPILSSSPTRFPAKAPPSDNKRRQSLSPGRAIVVENNFKGQKHPRSKSTPRIPPPKISVTNNNSKDFLNRRKVSRSVSPARRKPGDNLSVNNKSKADFLTVEDLEDKENDLPNYKKETSSLNNKTHTKPKDPESSKPPLNPTSSPRKVNSKVQNNTTRKPLDNTSLGKIENSPNKANIPKSPRKGITKENNLKSPTRKGETRENDMSQRSKYTSGFNSQRTISPSRNSTLKKNASKTSMVAKPVSKQPVVPIRPTSINNEKKKEEDKKEYLKSEIGNEKEEEKEPMLPKENGKEKKVEESFETPKNGSLVQNNNNSITNNNNYINSPKKNSPKKEVTPKTSPTRKTTPVTPPSKSPKKLDPRKRSLTRDDTSKSLPVQDLIKPTAPVTLMRTSTAPALAPAHPDIANRVTTAVESHMSPKSPSRKVMNKRVNEQLSKVSEVSSMSKESVRSSISTETMRAMGKESPRVKKNGMVQGTVKEEAEVEVLSANNLMRKDVATNNGHRNSAWDRPDNHIQVETDHSGGEDDDATHRHPSCCCLTPFSRYKCCSKCAQSKMYERVSKLNPCSKCQSKCCEPITNRLGSLCSKLNICKNITNPCKRLQCCGKLKTLCPGSSCCKRKPREQDVEGQGMEPKVTCAKRLKNLWRLVCCLNTGCCMKIHDRCGCCKKLACCKMGGCCGPLTPQEEVERQRQKRMKKVQRTSQQTSVNKEQSKIDPTMVEHQSIMRAGIPVLPVSLAWICMMLNVLLPGSGTFMSGLFCLCFGKPRFQVNDTPVGRFGSFIVQSLVAFAQLFTILFCLVGWGWSIWWGTIILKLANVRPYHNYKKHQRMKQAERNEIDVPVTNQNHVVDNI